MEYSERLTQRFQHDEQTYFYVEKAEVNGSTRRLGLYEDLGFLPSELANILTQYELQKPKNQWDMDKIEKWQRVVKIENLEI